MKIISWPFEYPFFLLLNDLNKYMYMFVPDVRDVALQMFISEIRHF